jgi:hypothetical protein
VSHITTKKKAKQTKNEQKIMEAKEIKNKTKRLKNNYSKLNRSQSYDRELPTYNNGVVKTKIRSRCVF